MKRFAATALTWSLLVTLLALLLSGCGGGGGGSSQGGVTNDSGGQPIATAVQPTEPGLPGTATVVINTGLADAKNKTRATSQADVVRLRFTGRDASGNVQFGPTVRSRASVVTLHDVPVSVVAIVMEALDGGDQTTNVYNRPVTLSPGQTVVVQDAVHTSPYLIAVAVSPPTARIAPSTTLQFSASGQFSDGSSQDLTSIVSWSSSSAAASISSTGLASGVQSGTTVIRAAVDNISGTSQLTVTSATLESLQVTPPATTIPRGLSTQLTATGVFSDATVQDVSSLVTWTSSSEGNATVDRTGKVTGVSPGSAFITATLGGKSASSTIAVSPALLSAIQVRPTTLSLPKGLSKQYVATALFTDDSTLDVTAQATWTISNSTIASVSNLVSSRGLVSAVGTGSTTVTATLEGVGASASITVTAATLTGIAVTPTNASSPKGLTVQFTATGTYTDNSTQDLTAQATWSSQTTSAATISNALADKGRATCVDQGSSVISATLDGISGQTTLTVTAAVLQTIEVTPTNRTVPRGLTQQCVATGVYSDNSTVDITAGVTWASSDPSVATISNAAGSEGLASVVGSSNTTTISATLGGVTGQTSLTGSPATLVSMAVTPANPSSPRGLTVQFTATGAYTDNSTQDLTAQATWSSQTTSAATISNALADKGRATCVDQGSSVISATLDGISGQTTLTVTAAVLQTIEVTPTNRTVPRGLTQQCVATGVYSDNSTVDITAGVTWASSDPSVATISNAAGSEGLASVVGSSNTTTISATLGGVTGQTSLTGSPATLVSIDVTPENASSTSGQALQFEARGIYTDSNTADVTTQVTWASSDLAVATISNADGSKGLASVLATSGSTTISATIGEKTGQAVLNSALPGASWTIRQNQLSPQGVAYGNGQFVAVGVVGTILTSPDGVNWTSRSSPTMQSLWGVAFGNGQFVAVGQPFHPTGVECAIVTSADGVNWALRSSGTTRPLWDVTFGGGQFVAVGDNGTILTSPNGVEWTTRTSGTGLSRGRVTYGNGRFVVVGNGAGLTSNDGVNWTPQPLSGTDVTYGNSQFVAVGSVAGAISTSPDGVTWTPRTSGTTESLYAVHYGNGQFVAVGWRGTILTSLDSITWTPRMPGAFSTLSLNNVTFANGHFVAVGDAMPDLNVAARILASPDAVTWTTSATFRPVGDVSLATDDLRGAAFGNDQFVAVGANGHIRNSPDLVTWTLRNVSPWQNLNGVTFASGLFVAVGAEGTILTSPDGVVWTSRISGTTWPLSGVAYGNGQFVAVGTALAQRVTCTSPDGVTWTPHTWGVEPPAAIAFGSGLFVGPGGGSADGITWTANSSPPNLRAITFGGGQFVAVGDAGAVATSPDGLTWTSRTSGTTWPLFAVAAGGGQWVAPGDMQILSSADATSWSLRISHTTGEGPSLMLYAATFGNGRFMAVGSGGLVVSSP